MTILKNKLYGEDTLSSPKETTHLQGQLAKMEKYLTEAKATIPEMERAHKESKHQLHIQLYETRAENQRLHSENVDLKSHAKDFQGEVGEMSKIIDDMIE